MPTDRETGRDLIRLRAAAMRAAAAVTPLARAELMARYHAAGLKVRTGKLLSAVARADVNVSRDLSALRVSLPRGIAPYPGQKNPDGFYRAANALNHGAVRIVKSGKLGASARRDAQAIALAARKGAAAGELTRWAGISPKRSRTKKVIGAEGTRAVVTKAWKFFRLSRAAKARIAAAFSAALEAEKKRG
ncbi:MAG: hypothetical protein N3A38_14970 [Planctomycetota bacterium]|nr:hypothetical protein [Planctomycetota bacterium]